MSDVVADAEVLFAVRGRLGLITLNRPAAINALSHGMVQAIADRLEVWQIDEAIATVAITGAGTRGLCAGGDIVTLYENARSGDTAPAERFWRDEYRLNSAIAHYPKPYVAIQAGIVLGGGIGISAHGSHRIVTETSRLGLPETGIGFIPDVGASWLLSHAPGQLGTRLSLTAGSVRAAEAIRVGLADVFVPSDRIEALLTDLETRGADAAIARHVGKAPTADAPDAAIDRAFSADSVPAVLDALREIGSSDADALADAVAAKSPTATAVALRSLRHAATLPSLEAALETEYRVSCHAIRSHDFAEGVRAQVIDKDRNPAWDPATPADVQEAQIDAFFAPNGAGGLGLADIDVKETA